VGAFDELLRIPLPVISKPLLGSVIILNENAGAPALNWRVSTVVNPFELMAVIGAVPKVAIPVGNCVWCPITRGLPGTADPFQVAFPVTA
jgi:hypothetical protein